MRTSTRSFLASAAVAFTALVPGACHAAVPSTNELAMTVVKEAHTVITDVYWEPYAVWWVEDSSGGLVRLLFITYFSDNTTGVLDVGCGKPGYLYTLEYFWNRFGLAGCPTAAEQCNTCPSCPHDYTLVDGVTGCSEHSDVYDTTMVTRTWDLRDRGGNRVPFGTYSLCYSVTYADEEFGTNFDRTYRVTLALDEDPLDTTATSPPDIAGTSTDPELSVRSIRIEYGGGDTTGSGPVINPEIQPPNIAPPDPVVQTPAEPDFCGNGGSAGALFAMVAICLGRRKQGRWLILMLLAAITVLWPLPGMAQDQPDGAAPITEEAFDLDALEEPMAVPVNTASVSPALHRTSWALFPAALLTCLLLAQAGPFIVRRGPASQPGDKTP